MKTYSAKPSAVDKTWCVVDADGVVLGRLASVIAIRLRGKHKPTYTPHIDVGDFVVVTNAEKIVVTGRKAESKTYSHYTYHSGGLKVIKYADLKRKHPDRIVRLAVRRMLPKSAMGRRLLTKLKIYAGPEHPHQSQQCRPLDLERI